MSRRKRGKEIRNVILFLLFIVILAGFIIAVQLLSRQQQTIMPPESQEIADRRLSRENALYTLIDAISLLPEMEGSVLYVPESEGSERMIPYEVEPCSIGEFLEIYRPDDDPEFQRYIRDCTSAIEIARDALDKEYFLRPADEEDMWRFSADRKRLFKAFAARAIQSARYDGNTAQAWGYIFDALRIRNMLDEGDGYSAYYGLSITQFLPAIAKISSEDELTKALNEIRILKEHKFQIRERLEDSWRIIDTCIENVRKTSPRMDLGERINFYRRSRDIGKTQEYINANRERYLELCDLSYCEFKKRQENDLDEFEESVYIWFRLPIGKIYSLLMEQANYLTQLTGSEIAVCAELYKRQYGSYPESLERLVPEYIESIPEDGFCKPFQYRLFGDDYWLYSYGRDEEDNSDSHVHRKHDIVIHVPLEALDE